MARGVGKNFGQQTWKKESLTLGGKTVFQKDGNERGGTNISKEEEGWALGKNKVN